MRKLLAVLLFFAFFLFANVTLAEQPPGFGKVLGEYDGEQVHYNGPSTYVDSGRSGYGITWQCVELVQRFWAKRGWGPNKWGADAFQMFDSKPSNATSLENGADTTPVPGDVLVFSQAKSWPYGHVALVTGVSNGFVSFVQQNLGEKWTDKLPISTQNKIDSQGRYPLVRGWIHSQKNSAQNGKTPKPTTATATATKISNQQPIPGATPKQPTATSTRVPPTATATFTPQPTPTQRSSWPPVVTTNAATSVASTSAVLNSTINPNGSSTNVNYAYGTSNVACASLPYTLSGPSGLTGSSSLSGASTQAMLSSLAPNTTYYFCVYATNASGTSYDSVLSFTTIAPRPPASVTIRTDRTSYRPGDRVLYCYTVSRPASIAVTDILADGRQQTLVSENDGGNGKCIEATATPPYGKETLRIDMYDGSIVVATANTSFTIIQDQVCAVPPAPPNVHEEDYGNVNGFGPMLGYTWDISPSSGQCKPFNWLVMVTNDPGHPETLDQNSTYVVLYPDDCFTVFAINSVGQGPGSRYCRTGGSTASTTIRTDKTTYRVGDQITYCYTVSRPAYIVITDFLADGGQQTLVAGNDDGTGDCLSGTVTPPYGTEMLRINMYDGNTLVATANASFTVIH